MKKVFAIILAMSCLFVSCNKKQIVDVAEATENSFRVISVSPEGELSNAIKYPSIQVQFNQPVIPLGKLGKPSDKSEIVTINPPLKGVFRWYGTSVLSFESSDKVLPQQEYSISINPQTKALNGESITGVIEFSFVTEEVEMENIVPGYDALKNGALFPDDEIPANYANDIAIYFSTRVNPKVISKYLKVVNTESGKSLGYSLVAMDSKENPDENIVRIKVSEKMENFCEYKVVLPAKSESDTGSRLKTKEYARSFNTLKSFHITQVDDELYSWGRYSNPVRIYFNHQLVKGTEADLLQFIKTEPEMVITEENLQINGQSLLVFGLPVEFDSRYVLKISEGFKDIYGFDFDGGETTVASYEIKVPEAGSSVSFKDWGFHILEAAYEPNLAFQFQNIKEESKWSVETLRGVTDSFKKPETLIRKYAKEGVPKDQTVVEKVPLSQNLEETENGFRGAIRFNADIVYSSKAYDWRRECYYKQDFTTNNEQVIQVSDLGVTVRAGYNKAIVLVTSLSTGKPVQGATVASMFFPQDISNSKIIEESLKKNREYVGESAVTDKDGLAVIEFPSHYLGIKLISKYLYIDVSTNDDHIIFRPSSNRIYDGDGWWRRSLATAEEAEGVAFMFTDRGLYKPGEKISLRGIDRNKKLSKYTNYCGKYEMTLENNGWPRVTLINKGGETSSNGTFTEYFRLPEDLEPGTYTIKYKRICEGKTFEKSINVQVQYFERLKFEANATIPEQTYYAGDKITASISAQYLGGGSLGDAQVESNWTREPSGFYAKSEAYKDFHFGPIVGYDGREWLNDEYTTLSGDGKASSEQKTGSERLKGMAYTYSVQAGITDASSQYIATSASVKVHPAKFYVGLSGIKELKGFAKKGDKLRFDYALLTPSEEAVRSEDLPQNKQMVVELLREDWKEVQQLGLNGQVNTRYQREIVTDYEEKITLKTGVERGEITVTPKNGGSHILRVSTMDKNGREVITENRFFVTSSDWSCYYHGYGEEVTLTPDQAVYKAGDKAVLLLKSILPSGRYLMTVERDGIISHKVFTLDEPTSQIEVPVEEDYIPVVYVTISTYSLRTSEPVENYDDTDLGKPEGYFGYCQLRVDSEPKTFKIDIEADKKNYRPGEWSLLKLKATKDDQPLAGAELTVMAVDRGVIDLIGYHVSNPGDYFYDPNLFGDNVIGDDSRSLLIDPVTYAAKSLFGGDSDEDGEKIQERKNFEPTALYCSSITTNENGEAELRFRLPDSLTAYRVTAVGVKDDIFALKESQIDVNNPISVRDVLPSELRVDDECEIGVIVTNMTEEEKSISVEMTLKGEQINCHGERTKQVVVKPNSTMPVMFQIKAETIGSCEVSFATSETKVIDILTKSLSVKDSCVYETVTTVGELNSTSESDDVKITEQLDFSEVKPGNYTGTLRLQLDSSRLGILSDAVNYVFDYPYGCMEQRSSRIFPLVAFGDYIKIFGLDSKVRNVKSTVEKEIQEWKKYQLASGGFAYWPNGFYESEYVSLRIGEILYMARSKGFKVDEKMYSDLKDYISTISAKHLAFASSLSSYAIYVRSLFGVETSYNISVREESKNINVMDMAYLAMAYLNVGEKTKAVALSKKIKNACSLTAQGVDIQKLRYSSSMIRDCDVYALVLQLLSRLDSEDVFNSHIVFQLLQMQKASRGYWYSTSTTTRVLIAFDTYIKEKNLSETNFTGKILIDGSEAVNGKFKGIGAEPVENKIELENKKQNVEIIKEGKGTLYYTMSAKYPLTPEEQTARDEGICVFSEVIDPETGDVVEPSSLKKNKIYKERVYVTSTKSREYVALRVPVAAGCEIMNAAFTTIGEIKDVSEDDDKSWGLSHQEIYPTEVQYFWDNFYRGNQCVEFYFRPNRTGYFGVPCITAECMYEPEIFGRTQGYVCNIE